MNPWLLKFADGTSFFAGMLMVIVAVAAQLRLKHRVARAILSILTFVGVLLVLLSSTPLPFSEYLVWLLFLAGAIGVLYMRQSSWEGLRVRLLGVGLFAALSLMLCLQELRYRWPPRIVLSADQPICIIGDSLSAGIGRGEKVWPAVLADRAGLKVTNLAVGGSKMKDTLSQAARISQDASLVILEIGGNDVLGNGKKPTDTDIFARQLDDLLDILTRHHHRIVMFELPLPPLDNAFGRAQRQLAARYGVALIPKTCLADALGLPAGTLDGLHLSQKGHDFLASQVQALLTTQTPAHSAAPGR